MMPGLPLPSITVPRWIRISQVMARARGALFADYWNGAAIRGGVLSGVSSQAIPMKSPVCEAELDQYRHPAFARQQTARQRQRNCRAVNSCMSQLLLPPL